MSSKRRMAREMALQMLYQAELGGCDPAQVRGHFLRHRLGETEGAHVERAFDYAAVLLAGVDEHRDRLDDLIREQADNWRLERMPAVDRNVLRLAVYELLHQTDIPKLVVLDEAIELAKKFGSENSGRFINGLLDGLLKAHAFPGSLT